MTKKRLDSKVTERKGVNYIEQVILEMGWIWREQQLEDFGIDGHIEICDKNNPTGKLIGVQVRSGKSYFSNETDKLITYKPKKSEVEYWKEHCLPVILVLVKIDENNTIAYFFDLADHDYLNNSIRIEKKNKFVKECIKDLINLVSKYENRLKSYYLNILPQIVSYESIITKMYRGSEFRMKYTIVPSIDATEILFEAYEKNNWEFKMTTVSHNICYRDFFYLQSKLPFFYFEKPVVENGEITIMEDKVLELSDSSFPIISNIMLKKKNTPVGYNLFTYKISLNELGKIIASALAKRATI